MAQQDSVTHRGKVTMRLLLTMIGIFVVAVVLFAVSLPVVGGVFVVVALAVGIAGWVQAAKWQRAAREVARSLNSDGDR